MQHDPRLITGIAQFNGGLFYECHETLEQIWLEEHGQERELYQGIIQIAAGYFKWQQDVLPGAIKLLRSGLGKLEPYQPESLGLDVAAGPAGELLIVGVTSETAEWTRERECGALAVFFTLG